MSKHTALVVIDVQAAILDDPNAHQAREVLDRISSLLARARASNTPVVFVQHEGPEGDPLEIDTPGWQIHPAVAPLPNEPVVHKRSCDSFHHTSLEDELEVRRIRHLIVTGAMTEYCVDTTCRRAASMGDDVTLVADAHTTIDNELLTGGQIIAYHNAVLGNIGAGDHAITVKAAADVDLDSRTIGTAKH